ncbi:MAG: chemotaxis protein CheW [Cyanobacteria bacterium P01_D01_bin.156]
MTVATNFLELEFNKLSFKADPLGLDPIPEDTRQRFLRFQLLEGYKTFLSLQSILEIRHLSTSSILSIPDISTPMLGVCNWRSEILWLADLNALVGNIPLWHMHPLLEQATVIIVEFNQIKIGLVVEQVDDIDLLEPQDIQQQDWCPSELTPYVAGCLTNPEGVILDAAAIVEHLLQKRT